MWPLNFLSGALIRLDTTLYMLGTPAITGDPYQTSRCACHYKTYIATNFISTSMRIKLLIYTPCHRWLPPQPDNNSCSPLPAHLDWTPSAHDTSCKEGWRRSPTRGNSLRLPHKASETNTRPKGLLKSRSPSSPPFLGLFNLWGSTTWYCDCVTWSFFPSAKPTWCTMVSCPLRILYNPHTIC